MADLDNGFMRPRYEGQIGVSYTQAGLLCTFIADHYENGLTRILEVYATTTDTVVAIQEGLGIDPEELDDAFFNWLADHYGAAAESATEYRAAIRIADTAIDAEQWAEARAAAERALGLYPAYTGPGNARLRLARALESTDDADREAARQALLGYFEIGGRDPEALRQAVQLSEQAGDRKAAYAIQHVLTRLEPLHVEHHTALGNLATALGRHEEALNEHQLALALDPHDLAGAHYQVAMTLNTLGREEEATRALLKALEIAPRYPEGLQLLREISR